MFLKCQFAFYVSTVKLNPLIRTLDSLSPLCSFTVRRSHRLHISPFNYLKIIYMPCLPSFIQIFIWTLQSKTQLIFLNCIWSDSFIAVCQRWLLCYSVPRSPWSLYLHLYGKCTVTFINMKWSLFHIPLFAFSTIYVDVQIKSCFPFDVLTRYQLFFVVNAIAIFHFHFSQYLKIF